MLVIFIHYSFLLLSHPSGIIILDVLIRPLEFPLDLALEANAIGLCLSIKVFIGIFYDHFS